MSSTHEVTNQPPPLTGYDVFGADAALVEAVRRHHGTTELDRCHELGILAGSPEAQQWAREADAHSPVLRTHDRYGHRVDEVQFHPSWHRLMEQAVRHSLHAVPAHAGADGGNGATGAGGADSTGTSAGGGTHVGRAAGFLVWSQVEAAHMCPISMTYAAVPALRTDPEIAAVWEPRLTSAAYDFGLRPAREKAGALAGMAMTEKQGGSDVRANTTTATRSGGGWYRLTGHKWFCSAPMNDVFLMLAHAPGGLSCFVVPRVLDDGTLNAIMLQRLKDKLGNRANASAEIELSGTWGRLLGDEGRGVATIIEMVAATRLDCTLGSAALMRRAVAEAGWHAAHRTAFGTKLDDAPLMQAVLADLAVESEAATTLGIRLAACVDRADDPHEQALRRIGLPLAKFWICKRTPHVVTEALECLGGNGYVEESGMPRLYREAPLNSIWEGAGNIQALDLLRVLSREPEALDAWRAEVDVADDAGATNANLLRSAVADTETLLRSAATDTDTAMRLARVLAARMAALLQASLLVRHAPSAVTDAFCATRLDGTHGVYGLLPPAADTRTVIDRATPSR
ncbi:acyl-CoA dehydrogenase family protein [Phytoactinopolyspora endophytica]|uniref:acyl-CoA dehydrogenase family protein n=1 Tax=Phytoactinopolyspora endophytica TaxID=1642495 RepID=UPI00197C78B4|nr:acyl-CoA dehydrogenase family protein [Phytoactinopolyspora endophytica]